MDQSEKTIFVYENWRSDLPTLIGRLHTSIISGQENFSFEYSDEWLNSNNNSFSLDPDLFYFRGRQYIPLDKSQFGLFTDSCPDRWGRLLMTRKEAIDARKESRKPRRLKESYFLLGVYDESRMGALRFSLEKDGEFLSKDDAFATPPWIRLRTLENASLAFENDESGQDEKWLTVLLAPGSSLGGARPKASVLAADGSLWIAKFPSRNDEYNSGAWEKVVHDLARLCSLKVPESKLETFSKSGSTFLVKRFDRDGKRRIHYASAMTLLGKNEHDNRIDLSLANEVAEYFGLTMKEAKTKSSDICETIKANWVRIAEFYGLSKSSIELMRPAFYNGI